MTGPDQNAPDLIGRVVAAFSSVKLTVALIAAIAVLSFLGTTSREFVLPLSASRTLHLDCTDVYHTAGYRILLGLLFTNLLVCSVNSLPAAIRRYRQDGAAPPPPREHDHLIHVPRGELTSVLAAAESAAFGRTGARREQDLNGKKSLVSYHSTGRISVLGPPVTHLGILLIIVGGLLASVATFEASVMLRPGEESSLAYSKVKVPKLGRPAGMLYLSAAEPDASPEDEAGGKYMYQQSERRLPFAIRVNDFTVTFYPNSAMAKDYLADLSIIKDGREKARQKIEVNRPLSFGGYDVYQASYEPDLKFRLVAAYTGPERPAPADGGAPVMKPGDTVAAVLAEMEPWTVPGDTATYVAADYAPAMTGMGKDLGPNLTVGRMVGDSVQSFRLFERYPKFDAMRSDRYQLRFTTVNRGWRTGLDVVHDPGLPLTYAGFVLLVLGAVQSLAVPHRRYWLVAERKGQGADLKLIGRTRKSKAIFERRLQQMADKIRSGLDSSS